jgi:hypothetical protein
MPEILAKVISVSRSDFEINFFIFYPIEFIVHYSFASSLKK